MHVIVMKTQLLVSYGSHAVVCRFTEARAARAVGKLKAYAPLLNVSNFMGQ